MPNLVPNTAGPVPKSWRRVTEETRDRLSPEWRVSALSLVLSGLEANHTPGVLPLTGLCIDVLLNAFSERDDFEQLLLPSIPLHLRYVLQRYTAIYAPLSTPRLRALVGQAGHINGELIVVGPNANLGRDAIVLKRPDLQIQSANALQDWEADDPFLDSFELQTLALVSVDLSFQTLHSLPRSLTRLALVDISTPFQIFGLPTLCPAIAILDLSFNSWLNCSAERSRAILGRVNWDGWTELGVLGLRGCPVHQDTLDQVNQSRWVDVQILLS